MFVEVTQFMRPNGRQVQHELEISDDCSPRHEQILECGVRLTAEQLETGKVSQAIECDEFDFDIILTSGADLEENKRALEKMIMRFDSVACKAAIAKAKGE